MRPAAVILAVLTVLAALAWNGSAAPMQGSPSAEIEARPRVIVFASRTREVAGYLELEDDEVIVVRRPDDELESFSKTRIVGYVRLVDPLPGQRGVVILRNGQASEGIILRDSFDGVRVKVQGIPVEFRREDVDRVVLEPTFEQKYAQFKSSLRPEMMQRHIELCRWLIDQKRYVLARKELADLVANHPTAPDALRMTRLVNAQLALQSGTIKPPSEIPPRGLEPGDDPDRGPVHADDLIPGTILTHDDVNVIRVYEIDLDRPPKVAISPDTIRSMLEIYGSNKLIPRSADQRNALFRADPILIVRLMFALRAREMYPQIDVMGEPYALNLFRLRVHNTWLMNNCSTSRCHGGPYAGRLVLHRRGYKDARVRYTNLLILERLEVDPAWPLINYESPMDSLIIQHGLPRHLARRPHPDVRGWKPAFTQINERMLEHALTWIQSMMQPRPEYPVDYDAPVMGGPAPASPGDESLPDSPPVSTTDRSGR